MLLALEIGNTSVAAGLFDGPELVAGWHRPTRQAPAPEALAPARSASLQAVVVAGVVPAAVESWAAACAATLGVPVRVVGRDLYPAMPVRYEPAESLGIDRLLDAVAALAEFGAPVLVADCGTATTLDAVAADGSFAGGAILCGIETAARALTDGTALLPAAGLAVPERALGRTTAECLQVGLVLSHAAALAGLSERMRRELGAPAAPLVGTGGLVRLVEQAAPGLFAAVRPDLTLTGLRLTYEQDAAEGHR